MSNKLPLNQDKLQKAVEKGIISQDQAIQLWQYLDSEKHYTSQFLPSSLLYYLGGILALSSMAIFVDNKWELLLGWPLFFICCSLFLASLLLINFLIKKKSMVPASVMITFTLAVTPIIIYDLQFILNLLPPTHINYANTYLANIYWLPCEFVTLATSVYMFYRYKIGFILFLIAGICWYLGMDIYQLLLHINNFDFNNRAWFSLIWGIAGLIISIRLDYNADYKLARKLFWIDLFTASIFWLSLNLIEWGYSSRIIIFHIAINLLMLVCAITLQRRVFAILGTAGIVWQINNFNLSTTSFSIILAISGIIIIMLGIKWSTIEEVFIVKYNKYMPKRFRSNN